MKKSIGEHQEQATFFGWVRLNRKLAKNPDLRAAMKLCYAVPNGFYSKSMKIVTDMKAEGLTKGIPDVNLDWPAQSWQDENYIWHNIWHIREDVDLEKCIDEKEFHGLRLEFKYRKPPISIKIQARMGTADYLVDLSPEQKEKRELLLKVGYQVKVVYSAKQAIKETVDYLPFKIENYQGLKEYGL